MQSLGSHKKGLDARTANCCQVHFDKRELAALNTSQLEVASSNFCQRNGGALLYHLAPIAF